MRAIESPTGQQYFRNDLPDLYGSAHWVKCRRGLSLDNSLLKTPVTLEHLTPRLGHCGTYQPVVNVRP